MSTGVTGRAGVRKTEGVARTEGSNWGGMLLTRSRTGSRL